LTSIELNMADYAVEKDSSKAPGAIRDVEMGSSKEGTIQAVDNDDQYEAPKSSLWARLSSAGVELRGAEPVPIEKRTDTRYVNVLTIFATSMTSLLP
jgi:hypothetical protein